MEAERVVVVDNDDNDANDDNDDDITTTPPGADGIAIGYVSHKLPQPTRTDISAHARELRKCRNAWETGSESYRS